MLARSIFAITVFMDTYQYKNSALVLQLCERNKLKTEICPAFSRYECWSLQGITPVQTLLQIPTSGLR